MPQVVANELNALLNDRAIVATDTGAVTAVNRSPLTHSRQLDVLLFGESGDRGVQNFLRGWRRGRHPDRQVVAFAGDGGLTMLICELATCGKYNLNVKIIVLKNNVLGQIKWQRMVLLGNPNHSPRIAAGPASWRWRAPSRALNGSTIASASNRWGSTARRSSGTAASRRT